MKRKARLCAALVVLLVYLMVLLRDMVRTGYLEPYFDPAKLHVAPQYSPMVLFLAVLVPGIASIVWLVWKARESIAAR